LLAANIAGELARLVRAAHARAKSI
jgi:hypothetical protein